MGFTCFGAGHVTNRERERVWKERSQTLSGKRGDERKGEGQQGEEIKKHIHKIPYASLL